jgi:hypothetical protein
MLRTRSRREKTPSANALFVRRLCNKEKSAVDLSFSVGDQNVSVLNRVPPLDVLQAKLERILSGLKKPHVWSV